jgi:hypothetical protein
VTVLGETKPFGPKDKWAVRLSCGHRMTKYTAVGWLPEHGHKRDPEKAKAIREAYKDRGDPGGFLLPWAEDDCPVPFTHYDCHMCANLRPIVSYNPIGLLTWPGDSARPSRETLTQQLRSVEARADELTAQLADAQAAAAKLREELG